MFRHLVSCALLCCVLVIDNAGNAEPCPEHVPAQREDETKASKPESKIEIEYRFGTNAHIYKSATQELKTKIRNHSAQQIECRDAGEVRNVFDKPLPVGWLYNSFSDTSTSWQKNFDTELQEHWVLPNTYCNANRVLTAISWMRSGKKGAANENKKMAQRFRKHPPPFYTNEIVNNDNPHGVYCDWEGWLFKKDEARDKYINTLNDDGELFTMVNIHCHNKRVTFMQHGYAGSNKQHSDAKGRPFENISTPSSGDGSIDCSWQGWLLKDGTDDTYKDKDDKTRWSYEKYFALDKESTGSSKKRKMHGRVINPFCSKSDKNKNGKVSRIRAYCFYSPQWKNKHACAELSG